MKPLVIAGGGLSGCLAALALAKRRPDVPFLLVEQGQTFGGVHTWSFFDSDVPADARWVLDGIDVRHWPDHQVSFPERRRRIGIGYNSFQARDLDRAIRAGVRPDHYRLGAAIDAVGAGSVTVGGETIEASAVLDARGPVATPGLELGWQKFVGHYLRFDRPHGLERPMIMDATVEQSDGYRFLYRLPTSSTEMLIEDTYYSASPRLDLPALRNRIGEDSARFAGDTVLIEEEKGVLPIVIGGTVTSLWEGSDVALLGLRGGFFHPTTSYSLPDAVANAAFLAGQPDLSGAALRTAFRDRAERLWKERGFFRLLNRMLFKAAEPDQSYRVLEHFYRLPPDIIGRFYAARLTGFDKLRILSGKPPVPIGRAIAALAGKAA